MEMITTKKNPLIYVILNKKQKSYDVGTNGQFLTLANILLQEYVRLAVSAE